MDDRIRSLQVSCRRAQLLSATCFLGMLTLLFAAWTSAPRSNDKVTAEVFQLLDDKGEVRGEWKVEGGAGHFELRDSNGTPRFAVYMKRGAACVTLFDSKHKTRLGLTVDPAGHPQVILLDKGQVPRLHMTLGSEGDGNLRMIDEKGHVPVGFGLMPDGKPWLRPSKDHDGGGWGKPPKKQ